MTIPNQNVEDQALLEEWKRRWLKGSFLTYITRGSEPIETILGKIKYGRHKGIPNFEMRLLLNEALSEAYRPDHSRYEEISQLLQ
jgi:hypothetical protein